MVTKSQLISFTPRKVFIWQLCLIFLLFILHAIAEVLYVNGILTDYPGVKFGLYLFDFDEEVNIPTFYSAIAILCSSIILLSIATMEKMSNSNYLYWLVLSIIFFFLSIDEIASIHERFGDLIKRHFDLTGVFFFAWVVPYGIAVVIFCILSLKFLIDLPRNFRYLFILSGATFVLGAIGLEMLGARHTELQGRDNITYWIITTCEELLEMLGISLFIYTLLRYIVTNYGGITISLSDEKS